MSRDNWRLGNQWAKGSGPNRTSFKPGVEPWNKGKRGYMGANATSFKPGVLSGRAVPIGTVTVRTDKNGRRRQHIKTADGWMEYAKWLWIEAYGMLIPGDVVHHIDGDSMGDRLTNLIAVPREVHPAIHNRHWRIEPTPEMRAECERRYGVLL